MIALRELYQATNGADWSRSDNWLTGEPCVDGWWGITCCPDNLPYYAPGRGCTRYPSDADDRGYATDYYWRRLEERRLHEVPKDHLHDSVVYASVSDAGDPAYSHPGYIRNHTFRVINFTGNKN